MDTNKKICALTTISKTMDWFVVDAMRHLAANGFNIYLVSNMDDGFIERNCDFAHCINLPMTRGIGLKDLFLAPLFLFRLFKKEKFDIIYYLTPNASFYASLAGFFGGVKCRYYSQCGLRYVSFAGIKRAIFKFIEKLTCKMSTTVRAQSFLNRQFAIDEHLCSENKISVVGIGGTTGVDIKACDVVLASSARESLRDHYSIPPDSFLYGFVGRINADKGVNELIAAFSHLQKKHENVFLILIGMIDESNPITEDNLAFAKRNPRIQMTGNISPDKVYEHMSMFDVLVHPTYREGFGKVLQEAMGMKLPIITTDVPGPSEVILDGESGLLCKAKDVKDLEDKMDLLYNSPLMRDQLALNGRRRAEQYFDRPIMLDNIKQDIIKVVNHEI